MVTKQLSSSCHCKKLLHTSISAQPESKPVIGCMRISKYSKVFSLFLFGCDPACHNLVCLQYLASAKMHCTTAGNAWRHKGLLACPTSAQGVTSNHPPAQGVTFTPAPLHPTVQGLMSMPYKAHSRRGLPSSCAISPVLWRLLAKVPTRSAPAALSCACLSNITPYLTSPHLACDLSAGITVALATTVPQLLKPLVSSAEGLAAILMQV